VGGGGLRAPQAGDTEHHSNFYAAMATVPSVFGISVMFPLMPIVYGSCTCECECACVSCILCL